MINNIFSINVWGIAKIVVLIGLFVYLIFAFVVVRQVKLMTDVVSGILGSPLKFLSWIFFLFSLLVFVSALVFL